MKKQLTNSQAATIIFALESVASDPGELPQDDVDQLLNLRDELAANDVWLATPEQD